MRVLFCGDHRWTNRAAIEKVMRKLSPTIVIEGGAAGADSIARDVAQEMGIPIREFVAHWKQQHRAAGPIRNKRMIDEGQPDCVVAFHNDIIQSKGTRNMILQARKAGLPVALFTEQSGYVNPFAGHQHTALAREKMKLAKMGVPKTPEHKAHISAAMKGKPKSRAARVKMLGREHTPDTRLKMSRVAGQRKSRTNIFP